VKKDDELLFQSEAQLTQYMWYAALKQCSSELKCFLVCGVLTQVWRLGLGNKAKLEKLEEYPTVLNHLLTDLHNIAEQHWA